MGTAWLKESSQGTATGLLGGEHRFHLSYLCALRRDDLLAELQNLWIARGRLLTHEDGTSVVGDHRTQELTICHDRKSVVSGKHVSVSVDPGAHRHDTKKKMTQ